MSVTYHLHDLVSVVPFVSQYQRSLNFLGADVLTCPSFRGILQILSVNTNLLSRTLFSEEGITNFYNIANNMQLLPLSSKYLVLKLFCLSCSSAYVITLTNKVFRIFFEILKKKTLRNIIKKSY